MSAISPNLLILGGSSEASALAKRVAEAGIDATFSYAGRVDNPIPQPIPVRRGGFGGADGLAAYIKENGVTHLIDATHPFAAGMSRNAIIATESTDIHFTALTRAPWVSGDGDNWRNFPNIEAVADHLNDMPAKRIFLAIGRQHIALFASAPQHHYLLRLVDPPIEAIPLANHVAIIARGPFKLADDLTMLRDNSIDLIISKNSGGSGARAKLDAARSLGLPVLMVDRPDLPDRPEMHSVDEVMHWIHSTNLGV